MDKMTFASYKFKPSDVIEGLNRYFAEAKAYRYLRVPLEIRNGEVKPGNYYVIRNIVFDVSTPKIKEYGYGYVICHPEEVVGVAINWLREEHDIFYTPGMNEPPIKDPDDIDDFCVDEAFKKYEKQTRTSDIFCEENEKLKKKAAEQKKKIDSYEATLSKITDIMQPEYAGPTWSETWDDLVERIKRLKKFFNDVKEELDTTESDPDKVLEELSDDLERLDELEDFRSDICGVLDIDRSYRQNDKYILAQVERLKKIEHEHYHVRKNWFSEKYITDLIRENSTKFKVLQPLNYTTIEERMRHTFEVLNEWRDRALEAERQLVDAQVAASKFRINIRGALGLNIKEGCTDAMVEEAVKNLNRMKNQRDNELVTIYHELELDPTASDSDDILDEIKKLKKVATKNDFYAAEYRAFVMKLFEAVGKPVVDEYIHTNYLALQVLEDVKELKRQNDDYANAKCARAELAHLYKELLGVERLDPDLSPHEIATRIKRCFDIIKDREQKIKMASDNHAEEAKEYYRRTVELKRELKTVREDLIEWIKGLRSVYTHIKGHEPPLEATPSATASVCRYEIDAMKTKMRDLEQKLNDIKDICDGNSDVMNIIG